MTSKKLSKVALTKYNRGLTGDTSGLKRAKATGTALKSARTRMVKGKNQVAAISFNIAEREHNAVVKANREKIHVV